LNAKIQTSATRHEMHAACNVLGLVISFQEQQNKNKS